MNRSTTYELERGEEYFELDIEFTTSRYYPAITYGLPEDCEPASGGEIETLVAYFDGKKFDLSDDERAKVEEYLYENTDYSEG